MNDVKGREKVERTYLRVGWPYRKAISAHALSWTIDKVASLHSLAFSIYVEGLRCCPKPLSCYCYACVSVYTLLPVYVYARMRVFYTLLLLFSGYTACVLRANIEPHHFLRHQLVVAGNTDTARTSLFYSGSTRPKGVGGMPLEVDFTHAYLSSLYP